MSDIESRFSVAKKIVDAAAQTAFKHFLDHDALQIESKGTQDWVSNADREVELEIRAALEAAFPEDGIVGEEHENKVGESAFTWVIDPIDGTTSFVNAMPGWCVVLACVKDDETVIGVIVDPIVKESYCARQGQPATLNGKTIKVSSATRITEGSVAVGHSSRIDPAKTAQFISAFLNEGGIYYRIGSGALMLAYVSAGRLLAYTEPHMNAWDCLAGLFLIQQAGGRSVAFDTQDMLVNGGVVITGAPGVFDHIHQLYNAS